PLFIDGSLSRQEFQLDFPEPHLRRSAAVQLKREDAAAGAVGIVELDTRLAVDRSAKAASASLDLVHVPFTRLHLRLSRAVPKQPPAVLLVEFSPPAGANIGLVALDLAFVDRFAAELDAAVARIVQQHHFEPEPEIARDQLAAEELVVVQAGR